jgi:hypothetical protein
MPVNDIGVSGASRRTPSVTCFFKEFFASGTKYRMQASVASPHKHSMKAA